MANPWQPGYVLGGRYELVKLVGAGAMGVVWRVYDREWGRDLAMKMPQPVVFESQMLRDRFVREAETWVGLGVHPHIVQCWFVSEIHGVPCLFLDFLTGGCLKSWIEGGHVKPGDWGHILEIAMQVAEGLAYAHSKGVVHRDVKPENLMIRGDERVCVTDFGLVKTLMTEPVSEDSPAGPEQEIGGSAAMTAVGSCLGTPMYGAPEQWGMAEQVGPPADIYALGIILYEMCCGRRPFDTAEERVAPMTVIHRHLSQPPPDPREFRPDMPVELARLCLKMLAKNPADRPQEMAPLREFLSTLHHKLTGRTYRAAAPLNSAQSPDVLNNQAFSLASLGKISLAVETLRRGLRLDPGHPECLYNLVQLEKRHGRIGHLEALRRLKQARAHFPRALLLIEEGMPAEALEALKALNPAELASPGLYYRALGDALMYLGQYDKATGAYTQAHELMPKDSTTELRGSLSMTGGKHPSGAIFFPSPEPLRRVRHEQDVERVLLDDGGAGLIAISPTAVSYTPLVEGATAAFEQRSPEPGRLLHTWIFGKRLAIADSKGFEFRLLPSLKLLTRRQGRILACSPKLDRLVTLEHSGPCLFQVEKGQFQPIQMEGQSPDMGPLLAAFDPTAQQLAFLLPSGHLAGLDSSNRAVLLPWPAQVEGHKEARVMALTGDGAVLLGFSNGVVQSYDTAKQRIEFTTRLSGPITSLEAHIVHTRLTARTPSGYHLLDRTGEILLYGEGLSAVGPVARRALVFFQGRLVMYNLSPLHVLRRWTSKVETPKSLAFSGDGRFAVALSGTGESLLWEMDEPNRVFQRELLMSPGRGYTDLLLAGQQFHRHLEEARQAFERRDPFEAHRHLQRARKVPGHGQGAEALEFAWQLLEVLRRDQLEAVWERLSIKAPHSGDLDLSADGRQMLYSSGGKATLALDQDGGSRIVWTLARRGKLRLLRFVNVGERSFILVVDASGDAGLHTPSDGRLKRSLDLVGGPIAQALLHGSVITYRCQNGGLGQFDLADGGAAFRDDIKITPRAFAPWQRDKILIATSAHLGMLDLKKPGSKLQALNLGVELTNPPCFIEHLVERGYLVLAFTSGTLHLLEVSSGRVLAALKHGDGNLVTGFVLLPELSVALTTTAKGQLCFWDLRSGQLMDKFIAQRSGISRLRTSHAGRYLLTNGEGEYIRLWETSWSAHEGRSSDAEATWTSKSKRPGAPGKTPGR